MDLTSNEIDNQINQIMRDVQDYRTTFTTRLNNLFGSTSRGAITNTNRNSSTHSVPRFAPSVDAPSECSDIKAQDVIDHENQFEQLQKENLQLKQRLHTQQLQREVPHSSDNDQHELLQKENIRLIAAVNKLERDKRSLNSKLDKLKIVIRGLIQMTKRGSVPNFDAVKMVKMNQRQCAVINSVKVQQIKDRIAKWYRDTEFPTVVLDDMKSTEENIRKMDSDWINDSALTSRIQNHIKINGLDHDKVQCNASKVQCSASSPPKVKVLIPPKPDPLRRSKRSSRSNQRKNSDSDIAKIRDEVDIDQCEMVDIHDVIGKVVVEQHKRVPELNRQRCIIAKRDIPGGTVLSQYTGTQYTEREFDEIFEHSYDQDLRNMYSFSMSVLVPTSVDGDGDNKMKGKEEPTEVRQKLVLDGYAQRNQNMMIYINDCRAKIKEDVITAEDQKYWNCSFRTVQVNGYPAVYVVTRRDIQKGEELLVYYGEDYGKSLQSKEAYEQCMARMRGVVDNILSILGENNQELLMENDAEYRELYDLTET